MSADESPQAVAYTYDESRLPAIVAVITKAYKTARSHYDIASAIFNESRNERNVQLEAEFREVASTFYYRFEPEGEITGKSGTQIEPRSSDNFDLLYWPRPLDQVGTEIKRLWAGILSVADQPEVRALIADLLFNSRYGKSYSYARQAIEDYVLAVDGPFSRLHKSEMLTRAWTIMRSIKAKDLEPPIVSAMTAMTEDSLESAEQAAGVTIPLIKCLLEKPLTQADPQDEETSKPVTLLFRALDRYTVDYLSLQLADMARKHITDRDLVDRALHTAASNMLIEAEHSPDSHVKAYRLNQAAKFARRYHLTDVLDDVIKRLQGVDPNSFAWTTIRAESGVRASDVEAYLRKFDKPYLIESLAFFFDTPPPSGSRAENVIAARKMMDESIFMKLFGSMKYGAHGLPEQSHSSDDEKLRHQTATVEAMSMQVNGQMLSTALGRMKKRHAIPDVGELHSWLTSIYGSDSGLCMTLATSLVLYWRGDYLACTQVAMPRVEAAVRSLCLLLNEPIYRVEEGKSQGQFPGLGAMLPLLEKNGFDPDWSSFLRALLLPEGRNLRNLGAHGFIQDVDASTAALVIRALGVVALLAPEQSSKKAVDSTAIKASLKSPRPSSSRKDPLKKYATRLISYLSCMLLNRK
jgi:hypothetical protein